MEPFFNPDVTPEMTRIVAQRAWFSFNVNEHNDTGIDGANGVDWRLAGEGIDTVDEAIKILQNGTNVSLFPTVDPVVSLDYGAIGECLIRVGVRNLQDLRAAFVSIYGAVYRPDVYGSFDDWNGRDVVPPSPPVTGFTLFGGPSGAFTLYGSTEPFSLTT